MRLLASTLVAGLLVALVIGACEAGPAAPTPPVVAGSSDAPREVNIIAKERKHKRGAVAQTQTTVIAQLAAGAPAWGAEPVLAAPAAPPKAKPRSTTTSRAQSKPKSAPRK